MLTFQFDINLLKPIVESSNVGYVGFRVLLFGENPWSCDCEHVNEIQQFLWHYKDKVPDAEELSCDDDQVSSNGSGCRNRIIGYPESNEK